MGGRGFAFPRREKVADIPLSQLQRATPKAILPEYRRAFSIYYHWPGIQVVAAFKAHSERANTKTRRALLVGSLLERLVPHTSPLPWCSLMYIIFFWFMFFDLIRAA